MGPRRPSYSRHLCNAFRRFSGSKPKTHAMEVPLPLASRVYPRCASWPWLKAAKANNAALVSSILLWDNIQYIRTARLHGFEKDVSLAARFATCCTVSQVSFEIHGGRYPGCLGCRESNIVSAAILPKDRRAIQTNSMRRSKSVERRTRTRGLGEETLMPAAAPQPGVAKGRAQAVRGRCKPSLLLELYFLMPCQWCLGFK